MRKLKSLWLVSVVLLLVSCSMSAKSDKSSEAGTASKGEVVTLNKAEFLQKVFNYEKNATKWVYEGDKPCIIDFYADWCGPCQMLKPIIEQKCEEAEHTKIVKINIDEEPQLAGMFQVMSIPTLVYMRDGSIQGSVSGYHSLGQIKSWIGE